MGDKVLVLWVNTKYQHKNDDIHIGRDVEQKKTDPVRRKIKKGK